ncbi:hypothetical protein [Bradyrhizobium brasilense]|uniref:hypothetical protein n=1 Tax=Bradyrhizobium brasilense TaxID=1419277 RepID=UPI00115FBC1D|nr:hypothetical protein [Bradyrhizobium brasilense]
MTAYAAALLDRSLSNCSLKPQCTARPERRLTPWEHEHLLEAVQQRLDANPEAIRQRRTVVPELAAEMALSIVAYNLTRVMNVVGIKPLIAATAL